ncbi:MAG: protein translocase SEC61 complex subunit gamma [Nanoarchaeota archaeon]|nr:protein translocase SEC61 complex subunit gamma [Nanoarchaeota archaeon]
MNKFKQLWIKLKSFMAESARVIKVTKKPNKETFKTIVKVSAMGMAVIGAIGFAISIVGTLIGIA